MEIEPVTKNVEIGPEVMVVVFQVMLLKGGVHSGRMRFRYDLDGLEFLLLQIWPVYLLVVKPGQQKTLEFLL